MVKFMKWSCKKYCKNKMKLLIVISLLFMVFGCGYDCPKGEEVIITMTNERAMVLRYGLGGDCIVRSKNMKRLALDPVEYKIIKDMGQQITYW